MQSNVVIDCDSCVRVFGWGWGCPFAAGLQKRELQVVFASTQCGRNAPTQPSSLLLARV